MHFKFETKTLDGLLSSIAKIVPSAEYVQFQGKDKSVRVMSSHEGVQVSMTLPCELFSEGTFAVVFADLKKLFRNRKEIEMKVSDKGNKVAFKAGSSKDFSGDMILVESHSLKFDKPEGALKLSSEQAKFMCSAVGYLALDDFYFKKPLPMTVYFNDKGGYCFVRSDHHVAVAKTKGKFDEATLTLPLKNMTALATLANNESFSIALTDVAVLAGNKQFNVVFPLEAQEENNTAKLFKVVDSVVSQDVIAAVEMSEVKASMDAIMAVHDGKASMEFSVDKKAGVALSIESVRGSVKSAIKNSTVQKSAPTFKVAPEMLANVLKNAKKGVFDLRISERLFSLSRKDGALKFHYVGTFHE